MKKNQQAFAVTAICLSIILAGVIIAYKPGLVENLTPSLPSGFRYPTGVGVSQGVPTLYSGVSQGDDTHLKTISLSGAGSASAQADQATVNLGVQNTLKSAGDAIGENADIMYAVIEAIKALEISEDDIVTTSYSVYPQYDWTDEGRDFKGYTVTNLVQVTVRDEGEGLDIVGAVIDAAAGAGANQINGISFELSDAKREELKSNAYKAALSDAEDKAQIIADTLELSITGVQSVTENSYVPVRTYGYAEEAGADSAMSFAPTPVLSGELAVTVNVHIVFLFE
jgi:uncharacterized protein YggE